MINGFYAAKSGIKSFQTSLDITANNIANANTQGFKAETASFTDLVYTSAQGAEFVAGNGSRLAATSLDTDQGGLAQDGERGFAIEGAGFFAIENAQGETVYTRTGGFAISAEGEDSFLTLPGGGYVLDESGQHIPLENGDMRAAVQNAALYAFPNPDALTALGNGQYAPTEASGDAAADEVSQIRDSAMELSNVDIVSEMTRMMLAQRGIQFNMRMLQTADELEQAVNSLRT